MAQTRAQNTKGQKDTQTPRFPVANSPNERQKHVRFVYQGNSSLVLTGLVSGRQYVFSRPGAIVEVDERDRHMLLAMPSLKEL